MVRSITRGRFVAGSSMCLSVRTWEELSKGDADPLVGGAVALNSTDIFTVGA
jgi:hypothetical protein